MTVHQPGAAGLRREAVVVLVAMALATVTTWLVPHDVSDLLLWLALVYVYGVGGLLVLRRLAARRHAGLTGAGLEPGLAAPIEEVVEQAVREERRRLAMDIRRVLLEALADIRDGTARLQDDRPGEPAPPARTAALRARAQLATSELRRLLGLLRQEEDARVAGEPPGPPGRPSVGGAGTDGVTPPVVPLVSGRPPPRDVLEAVVITALAALECAINLPQRGDGTVLLLPLLTTLLAATLFVGRSVAPILTALTQGLVFAAAGLAGAPVMSGVWMVRGVGAVLWRSIASQPRRQGVVAALALATAVLASRQQEPLVGVWATWAVVLVCLIGGAAAGVGQHRAERASREADELQAAADAAVRQAVATERLRIARELHDTVSHSVGVVAMQLNVLDVADGPDARRRALASIHDTSAEALRELTELDFPGGLDPLPPPRTLKDVSALVHRVRAAGLRVDLSVIGTPETRHMSVVYRVLQEALTNALQHAAGASVQVLLQAGEDGTHLVVEDDGPGPATGDTPAHYGVVGIRERVQLAGGTLHLGPRGPEGGFRASAHLPPGPTL